MMALEVHEMQLQERTYGPYFQIKKRYVEKKRVIRVWWSQNSRERQSSINHIWRGSNWMNKTFCCYLITTRRHWGRSALACCSRLWRRDDFFRVVRTPQGSIVHACLAETIMRKIKYLFQQVIRKIHHLKSLRHPSSLQLWRYVLHRNNQK